MTMPRLLRKLAAPLAAALLLTTAYAEYTVDAGPFRVVFYNNGDADPDSYTGAQDWTQQQMDDVTAAIQSWSKNITNTPGRKIVMHAFWANLDPLQLGGSQSFRVAGSLDGGPDTIWNTGELTWKKSVNLEDYGIVTPFDTVIRYDINAGGVGYTWNFDNTAPAANQVDFRSVIAHEIGHSLGFDSSYYHNADTFGVFELSGTTVASYGGLTDWDRNLVDGQGNTPVNGGTGTPGDFNEAGNMVYWSGMNAMNANNGELVKIYSPTTWAEGSSLVHVDEETFPNLLMSPMIAPGEEVRDPSTLELSMMADMGWSVVPEPSMAVLFGLCVLPVLRRRIRPVLSAPAA